MGNIDQIMKKLFGRIPRNCKIAFFSTIIVGLIAHLYMFTNKFPNHDDLITLDGFGATFRLGRWFLWFIGAVAYHLDFVYSLPLINGLISMMFIAVSAGLVVNILKIESDIGCALVGAAMVTFPNWVGSFLFMFIAPYFTVAVFLMVISVYINVNYKWGKYCSFILIAFSLGIYQAYLPFVATLYVVFLILMIFDNEGNFSYVFRQAILCFVQIVLGVACYFLFTKISFWITGQELGAYKGVSTMGEFSLERIPEIGKKVITNMFGVFLNNDLEISYNLVTKVMFFVLFMCSIYCLILLIKKLVERKEYLLLLLTLVLVICFEIAINGIFIMCAEGIYSLMYFSYVFFLVFPICMLERCVQWKKAKIMYGVEIGTICALILGIGSYCHYANGVYLGMELYYEQATSYCSTLITQIKSVEGYTDDMPVVIVGQEVKDNTLYRGDVLDVFSIESAKEETLVEAYSREYLLSYYCGFDPEYVSVDVIDSEVISSMPSYPDTGSIRIVDNIVVVKLSDI